jgi:hypothetical protein
MNLVKMMKEKEGEHDDKMNADDYWNKFSDGMSMGFKDFLEGYRHGDPNVSMDTATEHFT